MLTSRLARFLPCLALLVFLIPGAPARAADREPAPTPVVVAESEGFEAVGRLEPKGLIWYIDRADSNAPVLGARLEVEAGGRAIEAVFRPERGDYLIADADWLSALRNAGSHPLALTLISGDEADLLSGELRVEAAPPGGRSLSPRWLAVLGLAAALGVALWRRPRRPRAEGSA